GQAWQHLVAHRELIERRRNGDRRCLHIVFDDALVVVEVRVMRMGVVFDRILAEPDAWQPDVVEGRAVGAGDRPAPRRRGTGAAEILARTQPRAHAAPRRRRPEYPRPSRAPRAGVDIEVG